MSAWQRRDAGDGRGEDVIGAQVTLPCDERILRSAADHPLLSLPLASAPVPLVHLHAALPTASLPPASAVRAVVLPRVAAMLLHVHSATARHLLLLASAAGAAARASLRARAAASLRAGIRVGDIVARAARPDAAPALHAFPRPALDALMHSLASAAEHLVRVQGGL
jgi:hypothetical protein